MSIRKCHTELFNKKSENYQELENIIKIINFISIILLNYTNSQEKHELVMKTILHFIKISQNAFCEGLEWYADKQLIDLIVKEYFIKSKQKYRLADSKNKENDKNCLQILQIISQNRIFYIKCLK